MWTEGLSSKVQTELDLSLLFTAGTCFFAYFLNNSREMLNFAARDGIGRPRQINLKQLGDSQRLCSGDRAQLLRSLESQE
jgi:hypothetical protein